jgi:predicted O-linked N-acetylglucosamine transferase (SPINDLY family)
MEFGRLEETLSEVHWLLGRDDVPALVHSTVLFPLHYDGRMSTAALTAEHRRWAALHADPLTPARRDWSDAREPERRLRVGYVSPDLRQHPVGFFLAPVLAAHAAAGSVETVCYSCGAGADGWTARVRESAAVWRDARGLGDAELAELIERDGVDILVDLFGHTSGEHLLAFARKPAPLQVSWLGYVNTTGMKAMDYILLDPIVCPPGEEDLYSERPLRMERCYLTYRGPDYAAEVSPPPSRERGYVTFGSFNTLSKIGFRVLGAWAQILSAVPGARLLLRNKEFDEPEAREIYLAELERLGVDPARVHLEGRARHEELLAYYANLDIALDPFPYNGGTTTCEALWMGVPVVTLAGDRFVGRVGQTILTAAGLEELVAHSADEYIGKAVELAAAGERLAALRAGMRERVRGSALGDVEGFTRGLEHAYRTIWRDWCAANAG